MSYLTNNKFQTENIELKKKLVETEQELKESQTKNLLLRKGLGDLQKQLNAASSVQEQVDTIIFERSELNLKLEDANDTIISLKSIIEAKDKEIASIPREVIIQAPPEDKFEGKFNELNQVYNELLDLYNTKCIQNESIERIKNDSEKTISELKNSLENINSSIEKFKLENYRLRKNLPIIEEPPKIIRTVQVSNTSNVSGSRRMRMMKN